MTRRSTKTSNPTAVRLVVVASPDEAHARRSGRLSTHGLTIGRDGAWSFADPSMSRLHAEVATNAVATWVADLDSKNGTWVNGTRVKGRHELDLPAVLRIGETVLVVEPGHQGGAPHGDDGETHPSYAQAVAQLCRKLASDETGLISGPTGSDRLSLARRAYTRSGRLGPLVAHDAHALDARATASATEKAAGGGLFIDNIGALSPGAQDMLVQLLYGRSDVYFIAGHDDRGSLEELRSDLQTKLDRCRVELPPLAARPSDILRAFERALQRRHPDWQPALHAEVVEALLLHEWPREESDMEPLIDALAGRAKSRTYLDLPDLPARFRKAVSDRIGGAPLAQDTLVQALAAASGDVTQAARRLGIARLQLMSWMEGYGIDPAQSFLN